MTANVCFPVGISFGLGLLRSRRVPLLSQPHPLLCLTPQEAWENQVQMLVKVLCKLSPAVTPAAFSTFHKTLGSSTVLQGAVGMGHTLSEGTFLLSRHVSCPEKETDT